MHSPCTACSMQRARWKCEWYQAVPFVRLLCQCPNSVALSIQLHLPLTRQLWSTKISCSIAYVIVYNYTLSNLLQALRLGSCPAQCDMKSRSEHQTFSLAHAGRVWAWDYAWIYFQPFFVTLISYLWPHPFSSELTILIILYQQMSAQTENWLWVQKWSFYIVKWVFMYMCMPRGEKYPIQCWPRYSTASQDSCHVVLSPWDWYPTSCPHISAHLWPDPISTVHCAVVT